MATAPAAIGTIKNRGVLMFPSRLLPVLALAALTAACANDRPAHRSLASGLGASDLAAITAEPPAKKTLSSRVLAAIALENVTGRRPDPGRLVEGQ